MLKGKSSPHVITRFVVMTASVITFAGLYATAGATAAWLAGIFAARSIVLFAFTLKYGTKGTGKLDIACLVVALFGLVLWRVAGDPVWALLFSILADFMGFVPTIRKTYHKPKSEAPSFYLLELLLVCINMLTIYLDIGFVWEAFVLPIYIALLCIAILGLIYRHELNSKHAL